MPSLARPYSMIAQRHLTVNYIRERMGWSDQNSRGYWQDLRDSAQEFRYQNFPDRRWNELEDDEKQALCAAFTRASRHRALIQREEDAAGGIFISWWLLANTRTVARPAAQVSAQPRPQVQQAPQASTRTYYDPVRG